MKTAVVPETRKPRKGCAFTWVGTEAVGKTAKQFRERQQALLFPQENFPLIRFSACEGAAPG